MDEDGEPTLTDSDLAGRVKERAKLLNAALRAASHRGLDVTVRVEEAFEIKRGSHITTLSVEVKRPL